ncbi:hypothetical protein [Kitasatospora sp. NPDC017646]|uniref:hypothetical protein n=1 Tax=Kitasatospora sp. NPDC017646 TaxID=3364024 RepID=UPI0037B36A1E
MIDIVQAVGRALRQSYRQGKVSWVIIPVYLPTPLVGDDTAGADPAEIHDAGAAVRAEADTEIEASIRPDPQHAPGRGRLYRVVVRPGVWSTTGYLHNRCDTTRLAKIAWKWSGLKVSEIKPAGDAKAHEERRFDVDTVGDAGAA